jgi:maltose/moltooligosaccharide transporter
VAGTLRYTTPQLALLFFWLLGGDFGWDLKDRAVPPTLQILLRSHVSDFLVGVIIVTLPRGLSVLVYPIVGYISDRHRSRRGRRLPFIAALIPISVVAAWGLAWSRSVTLLCIFWALFEVTNLATNSLFLGLVADVVPKPVAGRFFGLFRVVALAAAILFNLYLLSRVEAHSGAVFIGVGIVYGLCFTLLCCTVKEGKYPPPGPAAAGGRGRVAAAIAFYARHCFSRRFYVLIFLAVATGNMALVPINTYVYSYAHALGMPLSTLGRSFAIQLFLSLIQAVPIGWLCDKFHPLRIMMLGSVLYGLSALVFFYVTHGAPSFFAANILCGTFSGFWFTAAAPLGMRLFPRAHFAAFDGAMRLSIALGTMLIGPACGLFLDHAHHDYRYVFLWTAAASAASLALTAAVYCDFRRLGGLANYEAP